MDIVDIARWLNRNGVSAAPCPWLSSISVFVDEHYENFDYDAIDPGTRRRISRVLRDHGFRQLNGRAYQGPQGTIAFPRPTRTLASDPAAELELVLASGEEAAFATPTQIILTTWRSEGPRLSPERLADLESLVREQPANLAKVGDWLRRKEGEADFRRHSPRLAAAQEEGFALRRKGRFRSRLPR